MKTFLKPNQRIDKFQIVEHVKTLTNNKTETYIVNDGRQKGLLKLFPNYSFVPDEFRFYGSPVLGEHFAPILHKGELFINKAHCYYYIRERIEGKRLFDIIESGKRFTWGEAVPIVLQILSAVQNFQTHPFHYLHNDLTARNILVTDDNFVYIIGTGHICQEDCFSKQVDPAGLNNWYRAPETFKQKFTARSDIFSIGVLFYYMLTGAMPWGDNEFLANCPILEYDLASIRKETVPQFGNLNLDLCKIKILKKLIALDSAFRYGSAADVIADLTAISEADTSSKERLAENDAFDTVIRIDGQDVAFNDDDIMLDDDDDDDDDDNDVSSFRSLFDDRPNFADKIQVHTGNGFADVAGLNDVKEVLAREVLFVLKNPDKAKRYRLKMLNGMMLYGPPGCGKTFIAQKFAEEAGIGFIEAKASDLGSEYIHATQCNIARLFDDAASKAPTILFIDEFDSMVPHRGSTYNASLSSEVNEFLTQLNNCAERGIFVITASNFPERIDSAVLRTGRIDKMVYIPAPDAQARREVFRISLLEREQEPNIDLDLLAARSEGLVASDIAFVVNQSALDAAIEDKMISQEHILNRLQKQRRSVSEDDIQYYESLHHRLEETSQPKRRAIGF